jgi:hypothetical protein
MHCFDAVPVKPGAHSQLKPPGELVQTEFAPQRPFSPLDLSHSSISIRTRVKLL